MTCRTYRPDDLHATREVFRAAVTISAAAQYSADEIARWITGADDLKAWQGMLDSAALSLVMEDDQGVYAFATLLANGEVHMLMCHPHMARQGVGGKLLGRLEAYARDHGLERLHTQASLTARALFERHGFAVFEERSVKGLTCFGMEKALTAEGPNAPDTR